MSNEQSLPIAGKVSVTSLLRQELPERLAEREKAGIARYGRSLETWNGRDAHRDLMEELLDAIQYAKQAELERKDLEQHLVQQLNEHVQEKISLAGLLREKEDKIQELTALTDGLADELRFYRYPGS